LLTEVSLRPKEWGRELSGEECGPNIAAGIGVPAATFASEASRRFNPANTSCRSSALLLSKDVKGLAPFWTKAKYGKMSIEGRDPVNTETPHYSKTGAVDDGKILITPRSANIPSRLQVRQSNRLHYGDPTPQAFPKSIRSFGVKFVVK
jgi:hypothetical protein